MSTAVLWFAMVGSTLTADDNAKVVIPFDFESKFDKGRYGRMVGEMIWKKLEREGKFVIPQTMLDVRDVCERLKFHPGYQTPIDEVGRVLREEFGGDIAIWGSVERVPPHDRDVYDLGIKVVDFSGDRPVVIYDGQHRTKTVSEIPHLYVKNMLMTLHGRRPEEPPGPDPEAERRWREGPNLVTNGSFENGRSHPDGWDPLPKWVTWETEDGNRFIRMKFPTSVADTTGVLYYSKFFPVEEGATYRFSCRYRTTGSQVKVFIKCYDFFKRTSRVRRFQEQWREVYRSQQNLKGAAGSWHTHVEDFTPKHTKYTPQRARVMLYAYHPAGTVDWDDIVVKQIKTPSRQKR